MEDTPAAVRGTLSKSYRAQSLETSPATPSFPSNALPGDSRPSLPLELSGNRFSSLAHSIKDTRSPYRSVSVHADDATRAKSDISSDKAIWRARSNSGDVSALKDWRAVLHDAQGDGHDVFSTYGMPQRNGSQWNGRQYGESSERVVGTDGLDDAYMHSQYALDEPPEFPRYRLVPAGSEPRSLTHPSAHAVGRVDDYLYGQEQSYPDYSTAHAFLDRARADSFRPEYPAGDTHSVNAQNEIRYPQRQVPARRQNPTNSPGRTARQSRLLKVQEKIKQFMGSPSGSASSVRTHHTEASVWNPTQHNRGITVEMRKERKRAERTDISKKKTLARLVRDDISYTASSSSRSTAESSRSNHAETKNATNAESVFAPPRRQSYVEMKRDMQMHRGDSRVTQLETRLDALEAENREYAERLRLATDHLANAGAGQDTWQRDVDRIETQCNDAVENLTSRLAKVEDCIAKVAQLERKVEVGSITEAKVRNIIQQQVTEAKFVLEQKWKQQEAMRSPSKSRDIKERLIEEPEMEQGTDAESVEESPAAVLNPTTSELADSVVRVRSIAKAARRVTADLGGMKSVRTWDQEWDTERRRLKGLRAWAQNILDSPANSSSASSDDAPSLSAGMGAHFKAKSKYEAGRVPWNSKSSAYDQAGIRSNWEADTQNHESGNWEHVPAASYTHATDWGEVSAQNWHPGAYNYGAPSRPLPVSRRAHGRQAPSTEPRIRSPSRRKRHEVQDFVF